MQSNLVISPLRTDAVDRLADDDLSILPTPLRLNADPRFTGQGVTICFIDSGFYPHPDLTANRNRIKAIVDITAAERGMHYFSTPYSSSWHGTMTSVVCAGDGYESNGLYKGIASQADVVLLKVQDDAGKISTHSLVKALEWVLQHHEKHNIRIVNMSVCDDRPLSYNDSKVDQLCELLFDCGVNIVAAVGNDEHGAIKPPANALHVIAVGGIDDNNSLDKQYRLYHSSYGQTADKLMKPELVANAIWIAAPLLPGTPQKAEAEELHKQLQHSNGERRRELLNRIMTTKYFHPSYVHVDGTSFAAPIVSSVIAQLLEIDPALTPKQVRNILFSSARRFEGFPAERQGFGFIQPRKAVIGALKKQSAISIQDSPFINTSKRTIEFFFRHECASQVALSGSFNQWNTDALLLEAGAYGVWKIEIPLLPKGKYAYKFFVDDHAWVEDVCNPYREPDGLNGWNSILQVQ